MGDAGAVPGDSLSGRTDFLFSCLEGTLHLEQISLLLIARRGWSSAEFRLFSVMRTSAFVCGDLAVLLGSLVSLSYSNIRGCYHSYCENVNPTPLTF